MRDARDFSPSHFDFPIRDVLSLLGWDGEQKPRGKWTAVRCPIHPDKRIGNAALNDELNSYRCHACGAGGNSVTLVMQVRGCGAAEAVQWLEGAVGKAPTPAPEDPRMKFRRY